METVVVAIIVGAFGGLLGSIAGPVFTHGLDRRRRAELRQEERNQEFRHMVETVMRLARTAHSSTLEIGLTELSFGDISPALLRHDQYVQSLAAQYGDLLWRPLRIQDATLRRLADGLNTAQAHLHMLIAERRGVVLGGTQNYQNRNAEEPGRKEIEELDAQIAKAEEQLRLLLWNQRAAAVRHWVDVLWAAVDRRMDELGW